MKHDWSFLTDWVFWVAVGLLWFFIYWGLDTL